MDPGLVLAGPNSTQVAPLFQCGAAGSGVLVVRTIGYCVPRARLRLADARAQRFFVVQGIVQVSIGPHGLLVVPWPVAPAVGGGVATSAG